MTKYDNNLLNIVIIIKKKHYPKIFIVLITEI